MKTHLLDSSVPLTEGQDQTAICGANVKDAAFVLMWDTELRALEFIRWAICRQCRKTPVTKRYIYGITDGQNVRVGEEA